MSGASFAEFLILCMIGLVVLGPKRLPEVARKVGFWVGKARRMTAQLKRQLEDELDLEKNFGFDPKQMHIPLDDDTYSRLVSRHPRKGLRTTTQARKSDRPDQARRRARGRHATVSPD